MTTACSPDMGDDNRKSKHLRGQIIQQPVVLIAADGKIIIAGQIDHVCRTHIHRVP